MSSIDRLIMATNLLYLLFCTIKGAPSLPGSRAMALHDSQVQKRSVKIACGDQTPARNSLFR
jgi:hypothetical protein